jgi:hypothetical protein
MNLTKKNIQKTSGIHRLGKFYKPSQFDGNYKKFDFCMELPISLSIKPIKKHKG